MKNYLMLACTILKDEIEAALKEAGTNIPVLYIPSELHLLPNKLQDYLQRTIDNLYNVDVVLLPMGRCGNGTLGLYSDRATIVLPKCEDCINLLLSEDRISVERPSYSYFLTDGWLREKNAVNNEYDRSVEKHGPKKAERIMKKLYESYKYFAFVDTGTYSLSEAEQKIRPLADLVQVDITSHSGPCGVLKKMVRLEFDENFMVVPPGTVISEECFLLDDKSLKDGR
jgi:hypothetical protein